MTPKPLEYIIGLASGMAGEAVVPLWTTGERDGFTPLWIRGLLVDSMGVSHGVIELSFDNELGNFARLIIRKGNKVIDEVVEYRGAWLWPLQTIAMLEAPLYARGRKAVA